MADDARPAPTCLTFLNEGLLLPACNRAVFLPILAVTVAYTGFADHAFALAVTGELRRHEMAAAYLLAAFLSAAINAVTAAAAVAMYTDRQPPPSLRALVREALRRGGVVKAGPVATAADGNVLLLASRVAGAAALGFVTRKLEARRRLRPPPHVAIDAVVAMYAAHGLLHGHAYLAAVASLAVVVVVVAAASSPLSDQPALRGTAAILRAWTMTWENAASSAVLVAADGFLAGAVPRWGGDPARDVVAWSVHVLLSSAARVFLMCAATAYYFRCLQSASADRAAEASRGRGWWFSSNALREMLQGRVSIRRILMTVLAKARCWILRVFVFVSSAPLVFYVMAAVCAWMATMGTPPSVFLPKELLSLRSYLRGEYQDYVRPRESDVCPKQTQTQVFRSFVRKA